ncbi:MAG: hypothetical protein CV087_01135 [Candidatus Brocadia sp. WS118]|nr:MAG: hypothetical protein CV087_01135 [Candidatus Brocadia sp. WS118]
MNAFDFSKEVVNICSKYVFMQGTRIPVFLIVFLVADGESIENIRKGYPSLTPPR